MDMLYNWLIDIGCLQEHVSVTVCVVFVLSVYFIYKTFISVCSGRR